MEFYLLLLGGYLLGSVPFGYLVSRARGVDIRKVGSGNIGGTNVGRALGVKWGMLVGILDAMKGFIPSYMAIHTLHFPWQIALVMAAPVVGYIFSVWLRFRGGKGISVLFGVLLPHLGLLQIILILAAWAVALKLVKIMSLVNIFFVLILPFVMWNRYHQPAYVFFAVGIDIVIWYAHRSNISRLLKGNELKLPI